MKSILVFRLGSIGDTVVALPSFRFLASQYPGSKITVLSNFPVSQTGKECLASSVLEGTGFVHQYLEYPPGLLGLRGLMNLRSKIRILDPEMMVYLMPVRSAKQLIRDWLFFRFCGIRRIVGLKFGRRYQQRLYDSQLDIWEHESHRLGRLLSELGNIHYEDPTSWQLNISQREREEARLALAPIDNQPFVVFGVGTKADTKDWGHDRWLQLADRMSERFKGLALVLIGSQDEYEPNELIARRWGGKSINLCGKFDLAEALQLLRMQRYI